MSYASSRGNYDSRDSQGFRSPGRATREGALPEWDEDSSTGAVAAGNSLSCFLEVKFRGNAQRTAAVDSDMPMWNEQVRPSVGFAGMPFCYKIILSPLQGVNEKEGGGRERAAVYLHCHTVAVSIGWSPSTTIQSVYLRCSLIG